MDAWEVRLVRPDELEALREIERRAGELFRAVGMGEIADDEPLSVAQLERFRAGGRAWVALVGDVRAGYVLATEIDAGAHVHQVSVDPAFGRRGIGRSLLDEVERWAQLRDLPALTLTTFADVPWNAPYYERLGFDVLDPNGLTPGLAEMRRVERSAGLDRWPRVAMVRPLC